jgi:hypothetical protein
VLLLVLVFLTQQHLALMPKAYRISHPNVLDIQDDLQSSCAYDNVDG